MIKAVIVDDEQKARENLKFLLNEYCEDVKVLDTVGTIQDAVTSINEKNPDCIFLDIKMRGETGFDLFESINPNEIDVIFTTAYDEYAIKAFKYNAIDYILKPIDIDDLKNAVEKIKTSRSEVSLDHIRNVINEIKQESTSFDKLALPTLSGLKFVNLDDILRCESDENYTIFYFTDGTKLVVSKTIKHFEDILTPHNFFRIHRSHMVNLKYITEYFKGDGGAVKLTDGTEVMVSRRKKESFLKIFQNISSSK